MTGRLHNYAEVRAYLEKEHSDWLRALTPRHINSQPTTGSRKSWRSHQQMPGCRTTSASVNTKLGQSSACCSSVPGGAPPALGSAELLGFKRFAKWGAR